MLSQLTKAINSVFGLRNRYVFVSAKTESDPCVSPTIVSLPL